MAAVSYLSDAIDGTGLSLALFGGRAAALRFPVRRSKLLRMSIPDSRNGAPIETAPRDGTLVLVWLKASEQGPAQMDVVRWARSARSGDGAWVARDSDQVARVFYSDADIECWMPLPTQREGLRRELPPGREIDTDSGELDGGGI